MLFLLFSCVLGILLHLHKRGQAYIMEAFMYRDLTKGNISRALLFFALLTVLEARAFVRKGGEGR